MDFGVVDYSTGNAGYSLIFFNVLKLIVQISLSDPISLQDIIHILISSSGKVNEDRALIHLLCQLHAVSHRMGAFNGGNDSLHSGKGKEGINGFLIILPRSCKKACSGPEEG